MKIALVGVVAAIGGASLGLVLVLVGPFLLGSGGGNGGSRGLAGSEDASLASDLSARGELRDLAERIDRIERALDELARASQAVRVPVGRLPDVSTLPSADPDLASRAPSADGAFDARRLLAEYVASFEGGGEGSEFFRMAVAAYAWQLRRELQAIVVDRDAPDALRLQVMAMFDGGSFRGDGATIDALLEVLRQADWEQGATAALGVLAKIGDRRTAELIEAVTPGLEPLRVRVAAWGAIAKLCGGDADLVLLRLFEREHDVEGRRQMIALFRGTAIEATLRAYELASRMEKPVRMEAAQRVGRFRDERFGALIDDWIARETDDEVRAVLIGAREQQKQVPGWHELQATGAPNVQNVNNDDQRAWATAAADGGAEWIELTYEPPLVADRVTIHEVCSAGAVTAVDVRDEGGTWRNVWRGDDPLTACGPFEVRFGRTASPVRAVRVHLDTKRRTGWNEIDAVELSGPGGSGWAVNAAASSRYGEGNYNGGVWSEGAPLLEETLKRTWFSGR